jgi:hypothetical protein
MTFTDIIFERLHSFAAENAGIVPEMSKWIYMGFIVLAIALAAYFIGGGLSGGGKAPISFRVSPLRALRTLVYSLSDKTSDEIFKDAGLALSAAKYSGIRNAAMITVMLFLAVSAGLGQDVLRGTLLLIALYAVSGPREYFALLGKKRRTPFRLVLDGMRRLHLERANNELAKTITQFKNLIATADEGRLYAPDFVLESLMRHTNLTRPTFARAVMHCRKGDAEGAADCFGREIKTRLGSDFGMMVLKLDSLPPKDFMIQITALQTGVREERRTKEAKKNESTARKIFILASAAVMAIMFDYMYLLFAHLANQMSMII